MKRYYRRFIILISIVIVVILIVTQGPGCMLPHAIIDAPNKHKKATDPKAQSGVEFKRIATDSKISNGIYLLSRSKEPNPTLFIFHGIRDRMDSLLSVGRKFYRQGYRVVLVDSRGHGSSSGDYLTYGVKESDDVKRIVDTLIAEGYQMSTIGVLGYSFGGSIALQWAAKDPRVKAVITVSTFSSLRAIVPEYVRAYLPLIHYLIPSSSVQSAIAKAEKIADFDADQADGVKAASKLTIPILFIHGQNDKKINPNHARKLHQAAKNSTLVLIKDANHDTIFGQYGADVDAAMMPFFKKYLVNN